MFDRKEIEKIEKDFKTYDQDKDECLDINELRYYFEKQGNPKNFIEIKKIIGKHAMTHAGKITFIEFLRVSLLN